MPLFEDGLNDRGSYDEPSRFLLDRHGGARVAVVGLALGVLIGLVTLRLWWPTQTEMCLPDEPGMGACRDVTVWVVMTGLLAVPSIVALVWTTLRERRR